MSLAAVPDPEPCCLCWTEEARWWSCVACECECHVVSLTEASFLRSLASIFGERWLR